MSSYQTSTTFRHVSAPSRGLSTFAAEVTAFFRAILSPGRYVAEAEEMGRLLQQANRLQGGDPDQAARLRRQAARLCA